MDPKRTTIRFSNSLFNRIEIDAKRNQVSVPEQVRSILKEHYSISSTRSLKTIVSQAQNLLPDFKNQQKKFNDLIEKMDSYMDQSQLTEEYVAEMKSAESFNMKETRKMFSRLLDSEKISTPPNTAIPLDATKSVNAIWEKALNKTNTDKKSLEEQQNKGSTIEREWNEIQEESS